MKKLFFLALASFSLSAFADTTMVAAASVSATKDAGGNVTIAWTEPLKVSKVERYIGDGQVGGRITAIKVGDKKSAVFPDVAKSGGRFNLVSTDGKYLHLGCDGDSTGTPKLSGLKVDCAGDGGTLVVE